MKTMKWMSCGLMVCVAAMALGVSADAHAAKKRKPKNNITFSEGSGETKSQRDARLRRECKGRPNAGACEGYTR
jgi:hypothetical protein